VCCKVEFSAISWSLVQRSPTDCGASLCVIYKPRDGGDLAHWGAVAPKKNKQNKPIPKELQILLQKPVNYKEHSPNWEPNSFASSIEPEVSLPCSQQLVTWLYHKPDQSSPCPPNRFLYATFWYYLPIYG
jgi:hypothetical protein